MLSQTAIDDFWLLFGPASQENLEVFFQWVIMPIMKLSSLVLGNVLLTYKYVPCGTFPWQHGHPHLLSRDNKCIPMTATASSLTYPWQQGHPHLLSCDNKGILTYFPVTTRASSLTFPWQQGGILTYFPVTARASSLTVLWQQGHPH